MINRLFLEVTKILHIWNMNRLVKIEEQNKGQKDGPKKDEKIRVLAQEEQPLRFRKREGRNDEEIIL